MRELQKIGQFDCDNVDLAGRMIAAMICEAALLLADAKHPRATQTSNKHGHRPGFRVLPERIVVLFVSPDAATMSRTVSE